jgi:hypothetical protein
MAARAMQKKAEEIMKGRDEALKGCEGICTRFCKELQEAGAPGRIKQYIQVGSAL